MTNKPLKNSYSSSGPTFHAAPTFEVTQEGVECTEGSHWRQSCNWCHCAEGKGACTKKMCVPGQWRSPATVIGSLCCVFDPVVKCRECTFLI